MGAGGFSCVAAAAGESLAQAEGRSGTTPRFDSRPKVGDVLAQAACERRLGEDGMFF